VGRQAVARLGESRRSGVWRCGLCRSGVWRCGLWRSGPRRSGLRWPSFCALAVAGRIAGAHTGRMWGSYSYAFGPVVAFALLGLLVLLLRWAFRRGGSLVVAKGREDQYGMLTPVASPPDYASGEMLRRRLEDAGIRANLASTLDGPRVMVWPQDVAKAKAVIGAGD
jgi:hypothetical protein